MNELISTKKEIVIVGAGLTGCYLAILLSRRGFQVDVYERFTRDEVVNYSSDKSFNLTFYSFGKKALSEAGVWNAVEPVIIPLKGTKTWVSRQRGRKPIFARYSDLLPCYAVPRAKLLEKLIEEARNCSSVRFHFGASLVSVNRQEKTLLIQDVASKRMSTVSCASLLGTDGVNSLTRAFLQQGQEASLLLEHSEWTYKQVYFPAFLAEKLELTEDVMYAWTGKDAVMTAFPNGDRSVTAVLILPKIPGQGFADLAEKTAIKKFVAENFPFLVPASDEIVSSLCAHPEGYLPTIYSSPWYYRDFMAVLGDAAHGFWPFYGQGMSAGFGDALELVSLLDRHGPDWGAVFPLYQQARKRHTDALADLSKEVFALYRRESRADYGAIYDRLEQELHGILPRFFRAPLFHYIARDPGRAADHLAAHFGQRRRNRWLGVPLAVGAVTAAVAVWDFISAPPVSRQTSP